MNIEKIKKAFDIKEEDYKAYESDEEFIRMFYYFETIDEMYIYFYKKYQILPHNIVNFKNSLKYPLGELLDDIRTYYNTTHIFKKKYNMFLI